MVEAALALGVVGTVVVGAVSIRRAVRDVEGQVRRLARCVLEAPREVVEVRALEGAVFVIEVAGDMTVAQAASLRTQWQRLVPGSRAVVMAGGARLAAVLEDDVGTG